MTSFILIPFYRIRGTQIFPSRDSGTEFVALSDDDSRVYEHRPKTTVVDTWWTFKGNYVHAYTVYLFFSI